MKNIIDFFKRIIESVLKILFGNETKEIKFNTFNGDELITLNEKTFLVKGEK